MAIQPDVLKKHAALEHDGGGKYMRQFIFGTEDGLIGNLGLLTGVSVATLNPGIIILSGVALMLTQAVSMGAGTWLSVRSQQEYYDRILEQEKRELRDVPAVEREEVRQIYRGHGFSGRSLERIVKMITSNEKAWLSVMMAEEFGISRKGIERPGMATLVMALSVMLGAFVPLIPYFFVPALEALPASFIAAIFALFAFGAAKTVYTKQSWLKNGLEMAAVGMGAALAGYVIGSLFAL